MAVEVKEQCKKCFHFQVCASVLKNDLYIREVLMGEKEPKCESFVEVVRCKDCKHKTVTSDGMVCECALPTKRMQDYYIYGSTILARVEPDAFCSYGERKDNGT